MHRYRTAKAAILVIVCHLLVVSLHLNADQCGNDTSDLGSRNSPYNLLLGTPEEGWPFIIPPCPPKRDREMVQSARHLEGLRQKYWGLRICEEGLGEGSSIIAPSASWGVSPKAA